MNLLKRANEMCIKLNIDPETIVEIKDLTDCFKSEKSTVVIGTVIKYYKDVFPIYAVLMNSGWYKQWTCNESRADTVRVIRNMKHYSLKQHQIAHILGLSQSQVSQLSRAKNIGDHTSEAE